MKKSFKVLAGAAAVAALFISQSASAVTYVEGGASPGADTGSFFSTAQSVVNGTDLIAGSIGQNDVDFYAFSWSGGNNTFDTDPLIASVLGGTTDTMLFLVNSSNVLLAWDDDAGTGLSSSITVTGLAAGSYAIGISNYANFPTTGVTIGSTITAWNNGGNSVGGTYHIDINSPVNAVPEPEIYAMMAAGLGLMGFIARRRKKYDDAVV